MLFLTMVAILFVPMVQMQTKFAKTKPLNGAFTETKEPVFMWKYWFDETFQQGAETYVNQNFGFRNTMVRLYNQLVFWLYDKTTAKQVVVGKDNYLYEKNYIKAYYGTDFVGDPLIDKRVKRLTAIQKNLSEKGILFAVAIAPGKAQFYPQYIPDYIKTKKGRTNYEAFIEDASKQGLHVMDFNRWFLQAKDTAKYPLYPKTGIHWSHYGSDLFVDSLIRYIEDQKHIDIPEYVVSKYHLSTNYQEPDNDIEKGMNLLFPIDNFPMPYGDYQVIEEGKAKPKIMVISDSFFWQIFNMGITGKVFNDGEFWYYNRQIFKTSVTGSIDPQTIDLHRKLLEMDVVILLTTDANLSKFPWEFDDQAYQALYDYDKLAHKKKLIKIQEIIASIKSSESWMDLIQQKAIDRGIPADSMLKLDAFYLYDQNKDKYEHDDN